MVVSGVGGGAGEGGMESDQINIYEGIKPERWHICWVFMWLFHLCVT